MRFILFFISHSLLVFATLQITSDLEVIEKELEAMDSDCLVLFDVDLTLLVPDDAILRPEASTLLNVLLGGDRLIDVPTGHLFRSILLKAPHSLVDPRAVSFVRKLQEKKIPVAAFTFASQGKVGEIESVADWRIEELKGFGFDFHSTFVDIGILQLSKDQDKEYAPLFKAGILFSSLHPKGKTLQRLLDALDWTPKKVVLIDDAWKHIKEVGESLQPLGIEYLGFHYTKAKDLPCDLDPERAQFQVRHFLQTGQWISDSQILNGQLDPISAL